MVMEVEFEPILLSAADDFSSLADCLVAPHLGSSNKYCHISLIFYYFFAELQLPPPVSSSVLSKRINLSQGGRSVQFRHLVGPKSKSVIESMTEDSALIKQLQCDIASVYGILDHHESTLETSGSASHHVSHHVR